MDNIQQIIEPLLKQIEEKEKEVLELKKAVNQVCVALKGDPRFKDTESTAGLIPDNIRPDQFFGQSLSYSVRKILEMRGTAMSAREIEEKLMIGGFDFPSDWKANQLKNLAITMAKNSAMIATLKSGNATYYGLLDWYPEKKKEREKKKNNSIKQNANEESSETETNPVVDENVTDIDETESQDA